MPAYFGGSLAYLFVSLHQDFHQGAQGRKQLLAGLAVDAFDLWQQVTVEKLVGEGFRGGHGAGQLGSELVATLGPRAVPLAHGDIDIVARNQNLSKNASGATLFMSSQSAPGARWRA